MAAATTTSPRRLAWQPTNPPSAEGGAEVAKKKKSPSVHPSTIHMTERCCLPAWLIMPTCKAQIFSTFFFLSRRVDGLFFPCVFPPFITTTTTSSPPSRFFSFSFLPEPEEIEPAAATRPPVHIHPSPKKKKTRALFLRRAHCTHPPAPTSPDPPMTTAAAGQAQEQAEEAVPRVVSILSALLQRVAERNDAAATAEHRAADPAGRRRPVSAFQGLTKPAISVGGYLERIFRFAGCSPSCYVVAYIYLDRFLRRRPALAVDSFNVHRLLITSVLTAVKFVDDICYNNAYFARVGGISLVEMNYLEVNFLFGIAFDLNVTPAAFASYCAVLQSEMAYLDPPAPLDLQEARLHHCYSAAAGAPDHHDDPATAAAGCHRHNQQQLTV
ncbi:hypothetical protein BS78_01G282900 [Paspalum vaginatum]|nr:hypothetical protein BS78_01G282900 [Paspalum vaginatum]